MSSRIEDKRRRRERDRFVKRLLKQPLAAATESNGINSEQLDLAVTMARRQYSAGQTGECDITCRRILDADSRQPDAIHLLGLVCQSEGGHRQAVALLQRAIELAPDNPEFHANLGSIYGQNGQFPEAISCFRNSIRIQPENIETIYNLGVAHVQIGEFDQAVSVYESAIASRPEIAALHLNCGGALQMLEQFDKAEACYRKAIAIAPDSIDAYFNLGTVLGRMYRFRESRDAFERVLALQPDHTGAHKSLADTLLKTGDNAGAATALQRSLTLTGDDRKTRFSLAHALALSGNTREAVEICEQTVATGTTTADNLITLALTYICDRQHEAAIEVCDGVLREVPGHTSALAFKSTALDELGRTEEALYLRDLDSLVQHFEPPAPTGFDDIATFNNALRQHVRNHPTLHYSESNRSLNNGQATAELLSEPMGPFAAFEQMIRQAISDYKAGLTVPPDHPFRQGEPDRVNLEVWANIMDANGFHDTHFHPTGWLSGTYYPATPPTAKKDPEMRDGCIEFGRSLYSLPTTVEPVTRTVRPVEGMLVLFPSFLGHRTIPFQSDEKRFSIAFDAIPVR